MILAPEQKLTYNVGNLGKFIVATGFEWLSKVQKVAQLVTLVGSYIWVSSAREVIESLIALIRRQKLRIEISHGWKYLLDFSILCSSPPIYY